MQPFERLEHGFGEWAGVSNVVACSSGTAALHLALESLHLPPGSEVITGDFNMIAVPRAITLAGLAPVFVDCRLDLNMDPLKVAEAVSPKTKALLAVSIYGRRCDMNRLHNIAKRAGLKVVEDLAEAHGVPVHPDTDAACWSFYRNKIIAGEEGGAVAFKEKEAANMARSLRCLGFTEAHDFTHVPRGHNYRLANALASLILDSLKDVAPNIAARRQVEAEYDRRCPAEWRMPSRDAVWVYDLRIPGLTREAQDGLVKGLNDIGVQARHSFKPMSSQPEYRQDAAARRKKGRDMWDAPPGDTEAEKASREVLYLPVRPDLTSEEMQRAFDALG